MIKTTTVLALFLLLLETATGQVRYRDPVFTAVSSNMDVYGSNFTVVTIPITGHTLRQPLAMRVYQPAGDTETKRPLVIYLHTGNFLPFPQNNSCYGTSNDSACVEFATRLAKMGYVVAVADYRLGWDPLATTELARRFTFINAVYRGVQDIRTCIRYFRKDAATDNNYKIDPEKIILWGQSTGAYLSLACATLDNYNELNTTSEPGKFMFNVSTPMVIQPYNGDIYGNPPAPQPVCLVDATYNSITGIPIGDTLCVPNHLGYSSDFAICVNMGGIIMDKSWLDEQSPPIISFHVLSDFFTPCEDGFVDIQIWPNCFGGVLLSGSCVVQQIIRDSLHINDVFDDGPSFCSNQYINAANAINDGRIGFYPFIGTPNNDASPWEWAAAPPAAANCNTNSVTARAYIDTIIGYTTLLACRALDICCTVGTEDLVKSAIDLHIAPNPATNEVNLTVPSEFLMQGVELFDASGRLVRSMYGINHSAAILNRGNLPNGIYMAKVYFEEGVMARMIIFE
jgi:hypothetical protein